MNSPCQMVEESRVLRESKTDAPCPAYVETEVSTWRPGCDAEEEAKK